MIIRAKDINAKIRHTRGLTRIQRAVIKNQFICYKLSKTGLVIPADTSRALGISSSAFI